MNALWKCWNFPQTVSNRIWRSSIATHIKNDIYAAMVKIDTGMKLQINGNEKMDMVQDGLEVFFHSVEIVV